MLNLIKSYFYFESSSVYKKNKKFSERLDISKFYMTEHTNKIPVVIDYKGSIFFKKPRLLDEDMFIFDLIQSIKDKTNVNVEVYIYDRLRNSRQNRDLKYLWNKYKEPDGFLYINVI